MHRLDPLVLDCLFFATLWIKSGAMEVGLTGAFGELKKRVFETGRAHYTEQCDI